MVINLAIFDDILQRLDTTEKIFKLEGLHSLPSKAFFITRLHKALSKPVMIITSGQDEAEKLLSDINFFLGLSSEPRTPNPEPQIYYFPPWEVIPYEPISPHKDISGERLKTLSSVLERARDENFILITPVESLAQRVLPKEILRDNILRFSAGDSVERDLISEYLVTSGYKSSDLVEDKGEFSIRGGILDIYPPDADNPFRMEFMGDEIDSIREFDSSTQRSIKEIGDVKIVPARELIITEDRIQKPAPASSKQGTEDRNIKIITDRIKAGLSVPGIEKLAPYFYERMDTLFDYIPSDAIAVLDEPPDIYKKIEDFWKIINEEYEKAIMREEIFPKPPELYISEDEMRKTLESRTCIQLTALKLSDESIPHCPPLVKGGVGGFDTKSVDPFRGNLDIFLESLNKWIVQGLKVIIVSHTEGQAERLKEILAENEIGAEIQKSGVGSRESEITIVIGKLSRGIIVPSEKCVFITEEDIFGPSRRLKIKRRVKRESFNTGLRDLKIGDYIVHVDYGIGQYLGTRDINAGGAVEEFLEIEYADSEKLYISMEGLRLIQKHVGSGGIAPPLDKMGGTSWIKTKDRIKKTIREMARELLRIYAAREIVKGFAFSPDAHWHQEFADSFEYEETEDQFQAIQEVIADMEKDKPMDRLVCGDVGYGKTEVAMRAAFKAVFDGRQAAILVPTTILAQQHFQTFGDRFHSFPVKIEVLSRFRSKAEQERVIKGLADGSVDIVIGTHRLLQKGIEFKKLGLLIIDEEQRFGVAHKERLKKMRETVDVLTLTATPIPRTLHLSLSGVRDLSIIDTAPQNRLAIKTFVRRFDDELIKQAILRELDREGQVFFVHNRVESIYSMAGYVQRLVPEAKIAVIHGQMDEKEMEKIMLKFINMEYNILVCTTIIESGLDIPAANTIIINRADKLGLAQLYQLRGRVGRERHQAYAYLFIPGEDVLSEAARKRLTAIEELSELGSGFKLAAKDMEIRGAGNILGAEQSGYIASVGFDLYCKLMEETVKELKGETVEESIEPSMKLSIKGHIPKGYVHDLNQRLDIYRRLDMLDTLEDAGRFRDELNDRYGDMPEPVEILISTAELKILSRILKIEKVDMTGSWMTLTFNRSTPVSADKIMRFMKTCGERSGSKDSIGSAVSRCNGIKFLSEDTIQLSIGDGDWRRRYSELKNSLQILASAC
ncbi:MAG: transcription-repair coupling factor [Nitrospinae bacterium]|nr:transcription-repair coupling factor [Nitrospinota bacterium]